MNNSNRELHLVLRIVTCRGMQDMQDIWGTEQAPLHHNRFVSMDLAESTHSTVSKDLTELSELVSELAELVSEYRVSYESKVYADLQSTHATLGAS